MRVLLRADASTAIGTGHAMRCLALVEALGDRGHRSTVASAAMPPWIARRLTGAGAAVLPLAGPPTTDEDAVETSRLAHELDADWLVVDGYDFGETYLRATTGPWETCLVDDLGRDVAPVSVVLNAVPGASAALYAGAGADGSRRLLLGPRYALLRREFRNASDAAPTGSKRRGILVTLGGADPTNVTIRVVDALRQLPAAEVRVIVGGSHPDHDSVREATESAGFELIPAPAEMAPLIASSEIVVGAGGTSALECAALGVPSVLVILADNQEALVASLVRARAAMSAGHPDDELEARIVDRLRILLADPALRSSIGRRAGALVDGRGAGRLVEHLESRRFAFRPASDADAAVLFRWANDPETRAASFDTAQISWQRHVDWLAAQLRDRASGMWIAELGGRPVGVLRFLLQDSTVTISVTVDPAHRGRGLDGRIIRRGTEELFAAQPEVSRVQGWIRRDNARSLRAVIAAGYTERADAEQPPGVSGNPVLMAVERRG